MVLFSDRFSAILPQIFFKKKEKKQISFYVDKCEDLTFETSFPNCVCISETRNNVIANGEGELELVVATFF